jgi:hypothetical protein
MIKERPRTYGRLNGESNDNMVELESHAEVPTERQGGGRG